MWVQGQTANLDTVGKAGVPRATRGGQPGGVRDRFWEERRLELGLEGKHTSARGSRVFRAEGQTVCEQGRGIAESWGTGG